MRVVVVAIALVLAGCGGHRHTVVLHAPLIQNLSITVLTPLVEGQPGVYEFRADFADPDGDLDGGVCAIDTSIGSAALPLSFAGGDPDATFGTVSCTFQTTVRGRVVSGTFSITDANGLTSNGIGFTLPAESVRRRT